MLGTVLRCDSAYTDIIVPLLRVGKFDLKKFRVALVWFEPTPEGTAPGYHLRGTRRRLAASIGDQDIRVVEHRGPKDVKSIVKLGLRSLWVGIRSRNVVARWHPAMLPILLLWRAFGCNVVLLVQGTFADSVAAHPVYGKFRPLAWAAHQSLRMANSTVAPHIGIARWVDTVRASQGTTVIPNGVPLLAASTDPIEADFCLPDQYVAFVGSLATWQGVPVMLRAVREAAWPCEVHLVVAGDGLLRTLLEKESHARVHYLGPVAPSQVRDVLRGSLASLSPKLADDVTKHGVSPFKLLEAGVASTMIIASRIPGQEEYVVRHACGLLVEPGSARSLAQAVYSAWSDGSARRAMAERGRLAAKEMAWERNADDLFRLLL